ncbi:MAG: hypothetical protein NC079_02635 [Clostridium sp.]|nr:hypothetical protein [Acetatifactor muris]MCM1527189.1 hypothetical protein [Bacteroides sp.]MCM1562486.1 hypothetical protein [Clostridium sp.]
MKIHNRIICMGLAMGALLLAGCGAAKVPDVVEETSLVIDKNGIVTAHFVDVLDREYYDPANLRKMAQEELAAYNTANQTGSVAPAMLEQVAELERGDGSVIVSFAFNGADVYADYTGNTLFYGTIAEAKAAGYDFATLGEKLYDSGKKKSIGATELTSTEMAGRHVVIWAEDSVPDAEAAGQESGQRSGTRIYCPYKVAYISGNAEILSDGSVSAGGTANDGETAGAAGTVSERHPVVIVLNK